MTSQTRDRCPVCGAPAVHHVSDEGTHSVTAVESDDDMILAFRSLILTDLDRAKGLLSQLQSELEDPVLIMFATAPEESDDV